MGNQFFACGRDGFLDPHTLSCRRTCGIDDVDQEFSCDPAGVVFDDTTRHLNELDRLTFRFAGSTNLSALRWLFVFGASPEVYDSQGTTLLHVAARTGSLQIVKDLVRRGFDPNTVDNAGWTALHVASCMGRRDVSLYLLQSGCKAHSRNHRGQTAQDVCSHPWTKEIVTMYDTTSKAKSSDIGFPTRATDSNEYGSSTGSPTFGAALHFEPFFVPRDAVLHEPMHREELQKLGVEIFNRSPGHGLAFLIAAGGVRDYPVEVNSFLVRIGAEPTQLGEFLGEDFPIAQTLRLEFLNSLPLLGTGVVAALETAFHEMAVPGGWVKADRLTRGVAHFWWRQHEEELQESQEGGLDVLRNLQCVGTRGELAGLELQRLLLGSESLHRLMFSALMLHQWIKKGQRMTLSEWVQLNTGIEGNGNDVPMHVQRGIYQVISEGNISLSGRPVPALPQMVPTAEAWAYVHYSGRAQITSGSDPAAWPDASPRLLAAQGGTTSAGRSTPFPDTGESQDAKLAGSPLDGGPNGKGEATWLSLHPSLLLLSSGAAADAPPYAFVSLRHAVLKETNADTRRILLRSRADPTWPPLASGEEDWLELCLLLGDGRFQPLEAPYLELQMVADHDFQIWSTHLGELCHEDPLLRLPRNVKASSWKGHDDRINRCVDEIMEATLPDSKKPLGLPGEEVC